jgi:membrane protease subunit HflC
MNKKIGPIVVVAILALIALRSAFFTVDETRQAIVVQLGKPISGIQEPGIHMKIPFIQEVIFFESRLLDYDAHPAEILTEDKKNLVVDNFAKWQIVDPLQFYTRVRNVQGAVARLDDIIFAELRVELGRHKMVNIISKLRSEIMAAVTERSDAESRDFGIRVVDVRIKRADLPQENERAVFGRMRAEREREAKRYRSEGQEAALKIRANADRERTIILAEAYKRSQELRGEGDASATYIYAQAFNQDPDFFNFLRSLESYRKSMVKQSTFVLSQEDEYLRFLKDSGAVLKPPDVEKEIMPVETPQIDAVVGIVDQTTPPAEPPAEPKMETLPDQPTDPANTEDNPAGDASQ